MIVGNDEVGVRRHGRHRILAEVMHTRAKLLQYLGFEHVHFLRELVTFVNHRYSLLVLEVVVVTASIDDSWHARLSAQVHQLITLSDE